jgi:hypothetical protein
MKRLQMRSIANETYRDHLLIGAALVVIAMLATPVWAQTAADTASAATVFNPATEFVAGHGSLSIDYSNPFFHGDYEGPAGKDSGQVRFQTFDLEGSYFVADGWEVRLGLPFSSGKYSGRFPHPQLGCPPCGPTYVDNGDYHGTWQDWNAGVSYHTVIGDNYYLTPSVDLYVPSHNYPYYGSAVVGQRAPKLGVGATVQHQFDFSNFYFSGHFQYFVMPKTLGINADYADFGLDLGYFINPRLGIRATTDIKVGNGHDDALINANCPPCSSQLWAFHDKFRLQDHANIGGAVDYAFNDRYLLSTTLTRAIWGLGNAILVYDIDIKLTRSF